MTKRGIWAVSAIAAVAFLGAAKPAQAQLSWTVIGLGEFDTDDVVLVLGGVSVSPSRLGWAPVAGVQASWLQYPTGADGEDTRSIITVVPSVGVKNSFGTGTFQFRVGYAFRDANDDND